MGKARNMAKIAVSDNGLIPATNLAAGAAIANLGFTPANIQGGDTFTGIQNHDGLSSGVFLSGQAGNTTRRFKVAKIASHYWGEGGITVEVFRRYYDNFGYAKYRVHGHTANAYAPSMGITALISNGTTSTISLSSIIVVDSAQYGWGYVDLYIDEPTYAASLVKVTTSSVMLSAGSAMGPNRIVMYPHYTY